MRPCRPARLSASSWLTRSTVVKKRPRDPARMQLRATAMARCVLPVPVPPTRTTLRCWAMKPPPARSRTSASLISVFLKAKSSTSLASGSLATVSFALDCCGQRLVINVPHPVELEAAHQVEHFGSFHGLRAPELIVAVAVGDGGVEKPQSVRRQDCRHRPRIALPRENVDDDVGRMDALGQRLEAGRLHRRQSVGEHGSEDPRI